jgi:hypothetical protein
MFRILHKIQHTRCWPAHTARTSGHPKEVKIAKPELWGWRRSTSQPIFSRTLLHDTDLHCVKVLRGLPLLTSSDLIQVPWVVTWSPQAVADEFKYWKLPHPQETLSDRFSGRWNASVYRYFTPLPNWSINWNGHSWIRALRFLYFVKG